jgi:AFG3 family protein
VQQPMSLVLSCGVSSASSLGSGGCRALRVGLQVSRPLTRPTLRPSLREPLGRSARLFCDGGQKKPPKGFEKFERARAKAEKSENSKNEAPDAKAEETAKDGSSGPKETPEKESGNNRSKASGSSSSGSSGSKGPKDDGGNVKLPGGIEVSRQTVGIGLGVAGFLAYSYFANEEAEDEITIQELMREHLAKGHVERIQIVNKSVGRVQLRGDAPANFAGKELIIQLGTPEAFESKIEQLQAEMGITPLEFVPIQYVNETSLMSEIMPMLPSLLILIPLLFAARGIASGMGGGMGGPPGSGGRNIFSIGKAFPAGTKDLKSKVKFDDVAGMDQAKREVVEFVDFLKAPQKYEALGARIPKGGLLVGPPGTGKTLLAKAVAGEADCPFFSMSGSDFIEMFVGVGPSRVRDLFKQAREKAPSIIFIDEIDAIGRKRGRGGAGGGNDERENTLNQMLVEMDGFSSTTGIVVLAGTNRVDILDSALTRPGRFDRQIAVDKPDLKERKAIFMVHLKPITIAEGLDMDSVSQRMAALTPGFAGADIANVCNESAIFAARRNAKGVEMEDFEKATERVMGGLTKENSLMSEEERKTVAIHESGHALVGWFLQHADPLLKVSIVPRSNGALGFAQYLPEEMSLHSQQAILDKIAVTLGGRAAEELFVGRISTGASDDLDKVTKMAYAMVSVYGMNPKLGLVSYSQNNSSEQFYKPYSEATGQLIDQEAKIIIEAQYVRVKELLKEKADLVNKFADELVKEDTLVYNQIVKILGERPYGIKAAYAQFVSASGNPFTSPIGDDAKKDTADAAESKETPAENQAEPAMNSKTEASKDASA